jgi:large subunit ribosomal protein L30
MPRLKVTQLRSKVGSKPEINDVVVKEDRPEIRGMVFAVRHLIKVEEVE